MSQRYNKTDILVIRNDTWMLNDDIKHNVSHKGIILEIEAYKKLGKDNQVNCQPTSMDKNESNILMLFYV